MLWLLLACDRPPEPAPPPAAPTTFSCAAAAPFLGHPEARVVACDALPDFPEVVNVSLEGGDLPAGRTAITVVLRDGVPVGGQGGPALAAWLGALPAERVDRLTLGHLVALLRAFGAFPDRFDPRAAGFDLPEIGTSRFTPRPFRLELYTGLAPEERFLRATLVGREVPWAWTVEERGADGAWRVVSTEPW